MQVVSMGEYPIQNLIAEQYVAPSESPLASTRWGYASGGARNVLADCN